MYVYIQNTIPKIPCRIHLRECIFKAVLVRNRRRIRCGSILKCNATKLTIASNHINLGKPQLINIQFRSQQSKIFLGT